jgi:hypothetical protein
LITLRILWILNWIKSEKVVLITIVVFEIIRKSIMNFQLIISNTQRQNNCSKKMSKLMKFSNILQRPLWLTQPNIKIQLVKQVLNVLFIRLNQFDKWKFKIRCCILQWTIFSITVVNSYLIHECWAAKHIPIWHFVSNNWPYPYSKTSQNYWNWFHQHKSSNPAKNKYFFCLLLDIAKIIFWKKREKKPTDLQWEKKF